MRHKPPATLTPPDHLTVESRAWWLKTVQRWQLEEHHIRLLSTLAKTWNRLLELERRLDVEGLTGAESAGDERKTRRSGSRTICGSSTPGCCASWISTSTPPP